MGLRPCLSQGTPNPRVNITINTFDASIWYSGGLLSAMRAFCQHKRNLYWRRDWDLNPGTALRRSRISNPLHYLSATPPFKAITFNDAYFRANRGICQPSTCHLEKNMHHQFITYYHNKVQGKSKACKITHKPH